jgi:hypothetical protein
MFRNTSVKKPYCKICHDADKPESEYTNHWVKDLNGKITCPTLLNTECRYCFKMGHIAKFCDVLAKNNKEKEKIKQATLKKPIIQNKPIIQKKPIIQNKSRNSFAVLCDDDEEEVNNIVIEVNLPKVKPEKNTSWAVIASNKPTINQVEEVKVSLQYSKPIQPKSWADWSDSEDEDDEKVYELRESDCPEKISYDAW